jgi:O-antigen ligase
MNSLPRAEWWRPQPATGIELPWAAATARPSGRASSSLAFRGLLAFTLILVVAPQSFFPALRPLRLALVAAVAGIAATLGDRLAHGRPLTVGGKEIVLTAALVAWAAITVPVSYWPGGSVSFLLDIYFKTVAIFWLLASVVDTLGRLRTLAWSLALMGVPLALTALKNFASGAFMDKNRIVGYEGALTANPNDLALMLNLLLPLVVGLLLASRGAITRGILLAIVLLEATAVIVTFSRGGFLSLAVCVGLYLWRLVRRGLTGWVLAALLACVGGSILLPSSYLTRLATITDIDSDPTGSAQARWSDSVAAVRFVADNPLIGAGIGMDTEALNEVRGVKWKQVHNAYLEYAVDLGLPGLTLFLLLFASCLKKVRSVRRRAGAGRDAHDLGCLAEGIEVALIGFAVGAFFAPVAYQFFFYYLAGLAVAAGGIDRGLAASEGVPPAASAS